MAAQLAWLLSAEEKVRLAFQAFIGKKFRVDSWIRFISSNAVHAAKMYGASGTLAQNAVACCQLAKPAQSFRSRAGDTGSNSARLVPLWTLVPVQPIQSWMVFPTPSYFLCVTRNLASFLAAIALCEIAFFSSRLISESVRFSPRILNIFS